MSADPRACFVDTNILVYAFSGDHVLRSPIAQNLVRELTRSGGPHTSAQVLQELFVTLTRKVARPFAADQALRYVDEIALWPVFAIDDKAVREAIQLSARASLSYWDALIVVAAARSGAGTLFTEDLQHGQKILGVEIVNPFLGAA